MINKYYDRPSGMVENAKKANEFEENRYPGSTNNNPHWVWVYPSWKRRLFKKFPYLEDIYPHDYRLVCLDKEGNETDLFK